MLGFCEHDQPASRRRLCGHTEVKQNQMTHDKTLSLDITT